MIGEMPPSHMTQSVLVTLFCCLPTGVVAVIYSSRVKGLWENGRPAAAHEASDTANRWAWAGFLLTMAMIVFSCLGGL
jgi:hypothetical protein